MDKVANGELLTVLELEISSPFATTTIPRNGAFNPDFHCLPVVFFIYDGDLTNHRSNHSIIAR